MSSWANHMRSRETRPTFEWRTNLRMDVNIAIALLEESSLCSSRCVKGKVQKHVLEIAFYYHPSMGEAEMERCIPVASSVEGPTTVALSDVIAMQKYVYAWSRSNVRECWEKEVFGHFPTVEKEVRREGDIMSHVIAFMKGDRVCMLVDINEIRVLAILFAPPFFHEDEYFDVGPRRSGYLEYVEAQRGITTTTCDSIWAPNFLKWVQNNKLDSTSSRMLVAFVDKEMQALQMECLEHLQSSAVTPTSSAL